MRLHVLYDGQGNIISAGVPRPLDFDSRGPMFGPQAGDGQYASEFEVPDDQAQRGLVNVIDKLKVDVQGQSHKLVAKP
jgi:hypothetical protein